jgi:monofunctional glycosyltransferase
LTVNQAINLAAVLASPGKHNPHMRQSQFMAQRRSVIYQNMFPKRDSLLVDSLRALVAPLPKDSF